MAEFRVSIWNDALRLGATLTRSGDAVTRVRIDTERVPGASKRPQDAIARRVAAYFDGAPDDFADVPVVLDVPPFHARVLDALRGVPAGTTTTYAALGAAAGSPQAARAVGQACARTPAPVLVPCHRVVDANGALGHYSGAGGAVTKARLLELEGARHAAATTQATLDFG